MFSRKSISLAIALVAFCGCKSLPKNKLEFIKGKKMNCCIVIPAKSNNKLAYPKKEKNYRFAAKLLQGYFKEVTGLSPEIVNDSSNKFTGHPIFIGPCAQSMARIKADKSLLPEKPEEYSIFPVEDGIGITGEIKDGIDRGVLFGIYKFAEKVLGIRWYFPVPEELGKVVPHREKISIAPFTEKSAPFYKLRQGLLTETLPAALTHPYLRTGSSTGPFPNHTQENWQKLYGKTRPDYFGINKDGSSSIKNQKAETGQSHAFLCYSNPAVLQRMIKNIEKFDKSGDYSPWKNKRVAPQGNYVLFAPDDIHEICQCPKCKKFMKDHKKYKSEDKFGEMSEYIFTFVSKYAEEIKKRWPERKLRVLAYQRYERPAKSVKLPDNVEVMLCLMQPISVQNNTKIAATQRKILNDWHKSLGEDKSRLLVWDYMCWPNCWIDVPVNYPATLKKWHNFSKDKVCGIFNNGMTHTNYEKQSTKEKAQVDMTVFMVWFYSRWMWDPDLNKNKMLKQFCNDLFGPASKEMQEAYKLMFECWDNAHKYRTWGRWKSAPNKEDLKKIIYPSDKVAKIKSLFEKASSKTQKGSIYHKRVDWFYNAHKSFLKKYSKPNKKEKAN